MKIGILTFHRAHNYGAFLQVYALQEYLKQEGYDVEIVDYDPDFISQPYVIFDIKRYMTKNPFRLASRVIKELFIKDKRRIRFQNFENYINKYLQLSSHRFTKVEDMQDDCDVYIMGSDQIWNPKITKGYNNLYFGNFKSKGKKISYAASMSAVDIDDSAKAKLKELLVNLDAISVREESCNELISPLTDKTVATVLDPTLLYKKDFWNKISSIPQHIPDKYILVYQVMSSANLDSVIACLKEQLGLEVIIMTQGVPFSSYKKNVRAEVSPGEFLGLIKNAECVITTSFHATVFSLVYDKPFYTVSGHKAGDARSVALLESLNMMNRFVDKDYDKIRYMEVDYSEKDAKLDDLRLLSNKFLKDALANE